MRVVITGASSGIGAATALAFAKEGAQLVLGARGKAGLEDVAERCRAAGGFAEIRVVDGTDAAAVTALRPTRGRSSVRSTCGSAASAWAWSADMRTCRSPTMRAWSRPTSSAI